MLGPTRGPSFDPDVLDGVRRDFGGEFDDFLAVYLDESRRLLDEMRHGLAAGDLAKLRRGGHTLRSTSRLFGLSRLSDLMAELEKAPADRPREELEATLRAAEEEHAAAERMLRSMAAPPPGRERRQ